MTNSKKNSSTSPQEADDTFLATQTCGDWRALVDAFWASPVGVTLHKQLRQSIEAGAAVYPSTPYRALELSSLVATKVLILGQDPYHGPGQADGLAFSVPSACPVPPSLRNIYKELAHSGTKPAVLGDKPSRLQYWAEQGVLLLNTSLSVEQAKPGSHAKWGWETLTDSLLAALLSKETPIVMLLWGGHAQKKMGTLGLTLSQQSSGVAMASGPHGQGKQRHLLLCANHPSPLSALRPPLPFIGCGHFVKTNHFLLERGMAPIVW